MTQANRARNGFVKSVIDGRQGLARPLAGSFVGRFERLDPLDIACEQRDRCVTGGAARKLARRS